MNKWWIPGGLCILGVFVLATDLQSHRIKGPLGGFREQYGGRPAVEQTVRSGSYDIYFCAFDMGHEVHMIAYARTHSSGELYQDLVRVGVHDPDGNALTVYRDHVVEVLDEPIRWTYLQMGVHEVTVELRPVKGGRLPGTASFAMPLNRENPTPVVLIAVSGIITATLIATVIITRKKRRKGQ